MVVINLYRFEDTVAKEGCTLEHAIETSTSAAPRCSAQAPELPLRLRRDRSGGLPEDLAEMKETGERFRRRPTLSWQKTSTHARYDGAISNYLGCSAPEARKSVNSRTPSPAVAKAQDLRYGEILSEGRFYRRRPAAFRPLKRAQLQGKELSYNNHGQ